MANKIELGLDVAQQEYINNMLREKCKSVVGDDVEWDKVGAIAIQWKAIMKADAAPPAEKKTRGPRKAKVATPPASEPAQPADATKNANVKEGRR